MDDECQSALRLHRARYANLCHVRLDCRTPSGIGYKIPQNDGNLRGGPCPYDAADEDNQSWFRNMNDLLAVRDGERQSHEIAPHAYGHFAVPFKASSNGHHNIGGGSFDAATGRLYLSHEHANDAVGPYANPPVIVAYRVDAPR